MGMPIITPATGSRDQAITDIIQSVALEQTSLSHILNAEGAKIQAVVARTTTAEQMLDVNKSVEQMADSVARLEMVLQSKLEMFSCCVCPLTSSTSTTTTTTTSSSTTTSTTFTTTTTTKEPTEVGSAWSVGTDFGQGNAQYTTLGAEENEKTVVLGLGANHTPIGTFNMLRSGTDLLVTTSAVSPYLMAENQLYVNDVAPTNSAPGSFPYQYVPGGFFATHTFTVDASAFAGETLFIAAHAKIFA